MKSQAPNTTVPVATDPVRPLIKIGQRWEFEQERKHLVITIMNKSINHKNVWGVKWGNYDNPGTLTTDQIYDGFVLSEESIVGEILSKYNELD